MALVEGCHRKAVSHEEVDRSGILGAHSRHVRDTGSSATAHQVIEPLVGSKRAWAVEVPFNGGAVHAVQSDVGSVVEPNCPKWSSKNFTTPYLAGGIGDLLGDLQVVLGGPIVGWIGNSSAIEEVLVVHYKLCTNAKGQTNGRSIKLSFGVPESLVVHANVKVVTLNERTKIQ